SLSPTALLVTAVYLGSDRPKLIAALYLVGALAMSLVMGVVILLILRNAGLSHANQRSARYGLRLGLGILLVAAGIVVARRRPAAEREKSQPGLVSRMTERPAPVTAFLAGLLIFAPGATFLASMQVIATAQASIELTAVAVIIVVVINVTLVWLPIVFYLAAPEVTSRHLNSFNGWLRANAKVVATWVLIVGGLFLVANGIYGLVA
ncbi:MAG TPA: GAP family protein, partial [Acidimicrobiales bacterium]